MSTIQNPSILQDSQGMHRTTLLETVWMVAHAELREQRRLLIAGPVVLIAALLFIGNPQLQEVQTPAEAASAGDTMAGLMVTSAATLLSLAALFLPVASVRRDLSRRTASFIWSRPISTPAYLLGRFLGALAPALLGALAALATGLWFVGVATHGNLSAMFKNSVSYLTLFGAQVPVAILYPAALSFCLAGLSGSEELTYLVGLAYWLAARVPLGNAWMVNFITVIFGGPTPAEFSLKLLGTPLLFNRLFYSILTGALLLTTIAFYHRAEGPRKWRAALAHPLGGRASIVALLACGLGLGLILVLVQQIHTDLPPAWQLFR